MLGSTSDIAATQTDITLSSDYELNGQINRASAQGAKFALLLAMLEQDSTLRPTLEKPQIHDKSEEIGSDLHHYRSAALHASDDYWEKSEHIGQLIQQQRLGSAHLWLAMHPEPLSLHNNPNEINPEVVANSSIHCQTRMQHGAESDVSDIKIDETGLFDILNELDVNAA